MINKSVFEKEKLSLWLKNGGMDNFDILKNDESCDALIVGAGIAGITTAYLLSKLGLNIILIDKSTPLNLTTGNTTAKFTFQHDITYSKIIKNYGIEEAKLYYEAQIEAMDFAEGLIVKNNIQCDFHKTYAMIYAETKSELKEITEEYEAYKELNIPCEIVEKLPYGIEGVGGLKVYDQFVVNPVKYLTFLLDEIQKRNVKIFKDANAVDTIVGENYTTVILESGNKITTKKLVVATGYPYFDAGGLFFTRLEPYRSYLAAFSGATNEDGMLITNSSSPYSMRFSNTDGINYLLVGGRGHKVGQEDSAIKSYEDLIAFAKKYFNLNKVDYRWSAQDYETLDKIPYIGHITSKYSDIYVATGFRKWGMTNGTFSAILLSSLINGRESKYEELFNPSRGEVRENLGKLMNVNLNVSKELIKGKVSKDEIKLEDIKNDEGGIIKYNGKRTGAYKDKQGKLYLVDSTCTHLGCELEYNNAERTFDCPCHGSRFTYEGKVIEGPAVLDLDIIEYQ